MNELFSGKYFLKDSLSTGSLLTGLAVVIGGIYLLIKYFKKKTNEDFDQQLLSDICTLLSKKLSIPLAEAKELIDGLLSHRRVPERAKTILSIQYEIEKKDATQATRTIAVAFSCKEGVSIAKLPRQYSWEMLPDFVRSEFILKPATIQTFSFYKKNIGGENAGEAN